LIVQRKLTNLDDIQFQRRRCEFLERLRQFAIERLFAKTANENGDVTNRAHLISQCTRILSPAGKLVHCGVWKLARFPGLVPAAPPAAENTDFPRNPKGSTLEAFSLLLFILEC